MDKSNITDRYRHLASKWKDNSISTEEAKEFADWYNADQDNEVYLPEKFANGIGDLEEDMFRSITSKIPSYKPATLWPRIAIAAAVTFMILGTGILWFKSQQKQASVTSLQANEVAFNHKGTVLTLANGKKIIINDVPAGEIIAQQGLIISKAKDGEIIYQAEDHVSEKLEYNILTTARGNKTQITLPDGSQVFLNAASSLRYPTDFSKQNIRRVFLTGEGYFKIFKDKLHPFEVITDDQQVEVLGTHFNVNAYANEPSTKTTLLEGSVRIRSKAGNEVILKPGQQARVSGSTALVKDIEAENDIAWTNDLFSFESEEIQTVMRMIERHYDIEVIYVGEITNEKFGGGVSMFDHVSDVLKSLESTGKVHFRLNGRKIYVSK